MNLFKGLLLGAVIGAVFSYGLLPFFFPPFSGQLAFLFPLAIVILTGFTGGLFGMWTARKRRRLRRLGHDKAVSYAIPKDDKTWVKVTEWFSPATQERFKLKTHKTEEQWVTLLNNEVIETHQMERGNGSEIEKCHNTVRQRVWSDLERKYK